MLGNGRFTSHGLGPSGQLPFGARARATSDGRGRRAMGEGDERWARATRDGRGRRAIGEGEERWRQGLGHTLSNRKRAKTAARLAAVLAPWARRGCEPSRKLGHLFTWALFSHSGWLLAD